MNLLVNNESAAKSVRESGLNNEFVSAFNDS